MLILTTPARAAAPRGTCCSWAIAASPSWSTRATTSRSTPTPGSVAEATCKHCAEGLGPIIVTHAEPVGLHVENDFVAAGFAALPVLLAHPAQPTAVVCYNDYQGVGLIRAARQQNVAVPGRLSVVGFSDLELSRIVQPGLTTLEQPAFDIGCESARMLTDLMEGRPAESVTVACNVIERESTAKAEGEYQPEAQARDEGRGMIAK